MKTKIISNISVDCVVFGFDVETKSINVLLIERSLKDEKTGSLLVNDHVLTGYHVKENETLDDTASRVLKELTGLNNQYKQQFKAFGDPNRLMNEKDIIWAKNKKFNLRTLTIAYYFLLPMTAIDFGNIKSNAKWFSVKELPVVGFDHKQIINEAYEDLKEKSLHGPIIFELLPDKFTVKEIQDIYESVLGIKIDNRNFRRKVLNKKYIIPLDEKQIGVSKKPAQLFMFSKDIYQKIDKKGYLINDSYPI